MDISQYGKATERGGIEERNQTDGDWLGGSKQIVERDNQPGSVGWTGIASEPLLPGQTPMRALRSGQGWRGLRRGR